ncbi:ACT domain-containing protein [Pseudomonas sp. EL_65y_Pfl2_R95]|uniref:ACT domain-containing protein n=1 Tax=Pseudomonas sp. EL_65y_Pfl2_R95 TaxID=3088698 RepID=UPI0030DC5596
MAGETSLQTLLQSMTPTLNPGAYVFCSVESLKQLGDIEPQGSFREREGLTVIISQAQAQQLSLNADYIAAWLTLEVHSALSAIGLTAAFANALATHHISCNVIAGYYHDHIFVDINQGQRALEVLQQLSQQSAAEA